MWAIVEIMGRRTRAGLVSDAQMGGATLLRIEHPTARVGESSEPLVEFYAPQAIFAIRPCDAETAATVAAWAWRQSDGRAELEAPFVVLADDDEFEELND